MLKTSKNQVLTKVRLWTGLKGSTGPELAGDWTNGEGECDGGESPGI